MIKRVDNSAAPEGQDSRRGRFRIAVIAASVAAAVAGTVLLAMRHSGPTTTTVGVTANLPVTGHPGALIAGSDALWVALGEDQGRQAGDGSLLRLDPSTGAVTRTMYLGGKVSYLARVGDRLIASVGSRGGELRVLDWRSGAELDHHLYEGGQVDQIVRRGNDLWALQARPGTLLRLDLRTLDPVSDPLRLSSTRPLALAAGVGYLWVTTADTGEVLRIDPATHAIKRVPVGGFPMGIVADRGSVWFADRERGRVVRLDPRSLRQLGEPIRVSAKPSWLAVAAGSLFVTDQEDGTVARIDLHTGKKAGLPIRIARPASGAPAPLVAPAGQSVWVSNYASNTITRINPTAGGKSSGKVTVRISDMNQRQKGDAVTDGGVAGIGRFVASGAISEKGKVVVYRTVKMPLITLRYVTVGKKGTITYVVKIDTRLVGVSNWTITSGTQAYKHLHGEGIERENANYSVSTLTGIVSR
jgi:streptogramin lyase